MALATISNVAYVFYSSVRTRAGDRRIQRLQGYTLAELALMDLAIRATPAGSEGLGFSLMMSVRNLALIWHPDWFGSKAPGPISFFVQFSSDRQFGDNVHHGSTGVPVAHGHRRPQGRRS